MCAAILDSGIGQVGKIFRSDVSRGIGGELSIGEADQPRNRHLKLPRIASHRIEPSDRNITFRPASRRPVSTTHIAQFAATTSSNPLQAPFVRQAADQFRATTPPRLLPPRHQTRFKHLRPASRRPVSGTNIAISQPPRHQARFEHLRWLLAAPFMQSRDHRPTLRAAIGPCTQVP